MTQQELAEKSGTSQPAIAAYEAGTKSPTVKTVKRIAASFGLDLFATFHPLMTREDRRSLAFHDAIIKVIDREPEKTLSRAKQNLTRLRSLHPHARELLGSWQAWLELPVDDLKALMLNPSPRAREMRQVSPFSGVLTPEERAQIIARFRQERAA